MSDLKYQHAGQQRALKTLLVLVDHAAQGVTPTAIAAAVGTLLSNTTRDLANLKIAGLAQQDRGLWFPTRRLCACAGGDRRIQAELLPE